MNSKMILTCIKALNNFNTTPVTVFEWWRSCPIKWIPTFIIEVTVALEASKFS